MIRIATLTLLAGLLPAAVTAQNAAQVPTRNVPDSLVAKAKISEDSARAVALHRVPGTVESVKLQHKSGKLDYVFGIKPNGKSGTEHVTINAMNAHVVSVKAGSSKPKSTTPHSS
jgi:uncharacterized membrane protein YkoI